MPYAVISIYQDSEAPVEVEVEGYGFTDIKDTEKYRVAIINRFSLNPQNVQVI